MPGGVAEDAAVVRQARELRSARVESLRALAALAVLEGHVYGAELGYGPAAYSSWWHRTLFGGGFGVYLFFTLSGYLLYLPFARRCFSGGRPVDLLRYARNRALRILPLYWVVAVTYLLVFGAPARQWALFLTFTENFSLSTVGRIDGPMWSLVVEVLFYILLPVLAAALAWVSGRSPGRAAVLLGSLGVAAGAYRWLALLHPLRPSPLVQYNLPATFYFFVPGMLLALLRVAADRSPSAWARVPVRRSGVWLIGAAACWAVVFDRYRWDLLLGPGSFLLVGACVLPLRPTRAVRALGWKPLAALGTASYSLYLWHLPIVDWLSKRHLGDYPGHLVVSGAACIAVAAASYRLVELPFLRLRTRWGETAAGQEPEPGDEERGPQAPLARKLRRV